jgi:hypothetical protein
MTAYANAILKHAGISNDSIVPDHLVLGADVKTAPFAVTAGDGPFVRGEVVAIVLATGVIAKLTAPPAAGGVLAVAAYDFDNSAAAVTAGNNSGNAQVYVGGKLNETALVFNGTATLATCRQSLLGSGIQLQVPLAFN